MLEAADRPIGGIRTDYRHRVGFIDIQFSSNFSKSRFSGAVGVKSRLEKVQKENEPTQYFEN